MSSVNPAMIFRNIKMWTKRNVFKQDFEQDRTEQWFLLTITIEYSKKTIEEIVHLPDQIMISVKHQPTMLWNKFTRFFYKKLRSGHSTKSFLISHEILSILASTKSFLISFLFFECRIINVVANTAANMFLDI